MAGAHVGAQQHRAAAGHGRAQPRDPFRRLPIGHARIGEAAHRQDRRIVFRRDIVVGRIGQDGAEILLALDRVAPFRPFRRRQRQRVVEHGVEHVDERHLADDAGEQFAASVGDRAHQHAAGAAAMADDALCAGVLCLDQRAAARPRNRRKCWSSSRACRRDTSPSPCPSRLGHGRWHRRNRDRPATAGWPQTTPAWRGRRSHSHRAIAARGRRA